MVGPINSLFTPYRGVHFKLCAQTVRGAASHTSRQQRDICISSDLNFAQICSSMLHISVWTVAMQHGAHSACSPHTDSVLVYVCLTEHYWDTTCKEDFLL